MEELHFRLSLFLHDCIGQVSTYNVRSPLSIKLLIKENTRCKSYLNLASGCSFMTAQRQNQWLLQTSTSVVLQGLQECNFFW